MVKLFKKMETPAKEKFTHQIKSVFHKFSANLSYEIFGAKFYLKEECWGEDPATNVILVQKGPEKNLFGFSKKKILSSVRVSDYEKYPSNNPHSIQLRCFDATLEKKLVSVFEDLKKDVPLASDVFLLREGYIVSQYKK